MIIRFPQADAANITLPTKSRGRPHRILFASLPALELSLFAAIGLLLALA